MDKEEMAILKQQKNSQQHFANLSENRHKFQGTSFSYQENVWNYS